MSDFLHLPCKEIVIERETRQRREFSVEDLLPSIERRGVTTPIIVDSRDGAYFLIAGERRLTASLQLGLATIPARLLSALSPTERMIIELEENIRRKAISWQEEVRTVDKIHKEFLLQNPEWTVTQTASETSYKLHELSRLLKVAKEIDDEKINKLESFNTAYNLIVRREERRTQDAIAELMQTTREVFEEPLAEAETKEQEITLDDVEESAKSPLPAPARVSYPLAVSEVESILIADFTSWIESFSGPAFNFIHCDFPYGVNVFGGKMSGRENHETYTDTADTYWTLLRVLCENLDKVMSHSAHIMFWYSMDYHAETLKFFAQNAPSLSMQKRPLFWLKSDNAGICPDSERSPRYIVETALMGSREDRKIVKTVSNGIASPTDKKWHHSTKPEAMLRHFFPMFVDDTTRLLDPTCGSGAALRAAESLGAEYVLGLEINPTIAGDAKQALREFRNKNKAAGAFR